MCIERTNPLGEKTAHRLHSDCTPPRQQRWDNIAPIQRVILEPLMRVCAVSLQCIVLALLFIDDILYNDLPVSNREDHDSFAPVVLVVLMPKTVYMVEERRVRWGVRVWLYRVTLSCSWLVSPTENILHTSHAIYIGHDPYAGFPKVRGVTPKSLLTTGS